MQQAYLIGLTGYPGHPLAGVPNDLALIQRALIQQGFAPDEIHTFGDEDGSVEGLRQVLSTIRDDFVDAEADFSDSHCFFYFGGSGMLAVDPLRGGLKPIYGDELDFRTALPFTELNAYLPVRPGIRVTVVLDC